jgi:hypothetical protein
VKYELRSVENLGPCQKKLVSADAPGREKMFFFSFLEISIASKTLFSLQETLFPA